MAGSTRNLLHALLSAMLKVSDQGSTTSALKQQLQQSGLLTALPGMLSTAAQEVSTYAEDPAQLAALFDNASHGSSSVSGAAMNTVHGTTPKFVSDYTSDLLKMPRTLKKLWGDDNLLHTPLASSIQPTVELAAAAVAFMCSIMQQQQQQEGTVGELGSSLSHLLNQVRWSTRIVEVMTPGATSGGAPVSTARAAQQSASNASSSTRKHGAQQHRHQQQQQQQLVHQLLVSPSWLRVSGFLLVAHCYALLRSEQPAPTPCGGVSDRGINSGSSSSIGGVDAETYRLAVVGVEKMSQASNLAANFAADWQDELPATHMQLLQRLGCSTKYVLWAAGLLAAQNKAMNHGVLCGLAAARTISAQWVRDCSMRQGQDSCADAAPYTLVDAAPDVLLATVTLHCAAHLVPAGGLGHPQTEVYVKLCINAAILAAAAWAVPNHINKQLVQAAQSQAAPLAPPSEQLQAALCAAQHLAAAEGEQAFFLQHITSQLLKLLREHAVGETHTQPATAAMFEGGSSSSGGGGSGGPLPAAGDAATGGDGSHAGSSSNSSKLAYAVSAVTEAFLALDAARTHYLSRQYLSINSNRAAIHGNHQGAMTLASVTADCAKLGVHTPLAACFQDCVRLGAVVNQLQPQREAIRNWCELFGALSLDPKADIAISLVLGGLTTPPGSPQQQQLFGLMCSLLETVHPKAQVPPGVQSDSQQDVPTCRKVVMTVLEVAAAAVNLQLQHTPVSRTAAAGRSTHRQPAGDPVATSAAAAAAAAAAPQAISTSSCDSSETLLMVPWLVLMGRCYLILALPLYFSSSSQHAVYGCHITGLSRLHLWLQGSSTSADLAVTGLNPIGLWQALQDALAAVQSLLDNSGAGADGGPSTGVQQQQDRQEQQQQEEEDQALAAAGIGADLARQKLHALGVCLSSLPLSWGCSSPVCTNLQGPTEAGIVQGKGHVCKGCHMARYCDKACQALHWKHHKPVCQAVAAAAGAAATKPKLDSSKGPL